MIKVRAELVSSSIPHSSIPQFASWEVAIWQPLLLQLNMGAGAGAMRHLVMQQVGK